MKHAGDLQSETKIFKTHCEKKQYDRKKNKTQNKEVEHSSQYLHATSKDNINRKMWCQHQHWHA